MSLDRVQRRAVALNAAIAFSPRGDRRQVLEVADAFDAWLAQPPPIATVQIIAETPVPRDDMKGTNVSLVMPDNDMVVLSITAFDVEKVPVASDFTDPDGPYLAPFTWAADNADLVELAPADDTLSVNVRSVPGQVGTVAVTPTDANGKALTPFTIEIDPTAAVTAGVVAGAPVPRDDNPPA